jgi:hypothetical protein
VLEQVALTLLKRVGLDFVVLQVKEVEEVADEIAPQRMRRRREACGL